MTKTEFTAHKLSKIDRAVTDRRLTHFNFRLLWFLAAAAKSQTGIVRGKQTAIAQALGVDRRTVQRGLDCLVELHYLKPLGEKRHGNVNAYNILKPKDAAQESHLGSAAKDAVPTPHQCGTGDTKMRSYDRNTTLSSTLINLPSEPTLQTDDRGPRQRVNALGPLGGEQEAREPRFGELEPDLRRLLGDRYEKWLPMVRLADRSPETVTLSVLTVHQADNIRKHCETEILAASGAHELKFVVELADHLAAGARS